MSLCEIPQGYEGIVKCIDCEEKMKCFLLSLGCFEGEKIKLVAKIADNYIVGIKNSRYAIDKQLAQIIQVS